MGIFTRGGSDDIRRASDGRSTSKTTKDVATTGRGRDLDLTGQDREEGRITDKLIRDADRRR